jgi:hypothetical protein
MALRLELSPLTEARLLQQAHDEGLRPEAVAERLLTEVLNASSSPTGKLSIEQLHRMLDAIGKGSEGLPEIPTEGFSRESFYEDEMNGGTSVSR